jgi:hydrogenase nickel incorporation protein HypB
MPRISSKKEPHIKAPAIETRFHGTDPVAKLNRKILAEAGVFAVSVSGGLGCGKTALIEATIQKLLPDIRVGVIACDVASHLDTERIMRGSDQVVQINTGQQGTPDASHIHDGLKWLDLSKIDLLLIENVGILVGPNPLQLGQDATAAVFSVAGGHDKADKQPELVRSADIVLLNKTDLLRAVPFALSTFRADVHRLNPAARLLELSALNGEGLDQWLAWLAARINKRHPVPTAAS